MSSTPDETSTNEAPSMAPSAAAPPNGGARNASTAGDDGLTREIPLRSLLGSPDNVRKTGRRSAIKSLATSIAEIGLLQNLVVIDAAPGDRSGATPQTPENEPLYRVIAGERRLTALRKLADAGRLSWDHAVKCTVRTVRDGASATEVSLVENVIRQRLNPMDECEAYSKLIAENATLAEIAHRFSVTERHIKQRLKLAGLSESVKQAGREGLITLGLLEAFSVSNNHADQDRVLKQGLEQGAIEAAEWRADEDEEHAGPRADQPAWSEYLDPAWVKRELSQGLMLTTAPEVEAVGLDSYRARGGELSEDLFSTLDEDIPQYILNPGLVHELLKERLAAVADEIRAEAPPWKWVEIQPDAQHRNTLPYGRVGRKATPPPDVSGKIEELEASGINDPSFSPYGHNGLDPDEWNRLKAYYDQYTALKDEWSNKHVYTAAERAISGCIIVFRWNGINIERGLVKREDYPAPAAGVFEWTDETAQPGCVGTGRNTPEQTPQVAEGDATTTSPDETAHEGASETAGAAETTDTEAETANENAQTSTSPWRPVPENKAVPEERTIVFHPAASKTNGQGPYAVGEGDDGTEPEHAGPAAVYQDRTKAILKEHGLTGAAAERLRRRRMATVRVHAQTNAKLLMDVFTYHHWTSSYAGTLHPGALDSAAFFSEGRSLHITTEMNSDLRGSVPADEDTAASTAVKAADRADSRLNLEWLKEEDAAARFRALHALPPGMRQRLFAAAVTSLMRPQLAIDTNANLALEAAIDAMNIDWAGTCRPDADYWRQTPTGWIRRNLTDTVSPKFASAKTKGRKAEIAERLDQLFAGKDGGDPDVAPEDRERIERWEIPGMRPRITADDPRMLTAEERAARESEETHESGAETPAPEAGGKTPTPPPAADDATVEAPSVTTRQTAPKTSGATEPEPPTDAAERAASRNGDGHTDPPTPAETGLDLLTDADAATPAAETSPGETSPGSGADGEDTDRFDHQEATELPTFLQMND